MFTTKELLHEKYFYNLQQEIECESGEISMKSEVIEVELHDFIFSKDKEGRYSCYVIIHPVNDFPEWYDDEYWHDESAVPLSDLYDNKFWAGIIRVNH